MKDFVIKTYSKAELAMLYFPDANSTHVAVKHLMAWIKRCTPLYQELQQAGLQARDKTFTPKHVKIIVEYLGEP